jgi:hypothetical protein
MFEIVVIIMLLAYVGGYIPTARWLFYSDREKQEAVEQKYNEQIRRINDRYESAIKQWERECEQIRNTKSYRPNPSFPYRRSSEYPDKRDYRFRTRTQSEQRALLLALVWFGVLAIEIMFATPKLIGKVIFSKRTPYERHVAKKEMDRVIADLEKSELP